MLFARRDRLSLLRRLAAFVWPRSGFRRAATYVGYRLLRLPGTPYSIAGGFAWGAAVSFTPFIGLHFFLAGLFAWITRCSLFAAMTGTVVGNPWTFPFIWAWIYLCGGWILGLEPSPTPTLEGLRLLFSGLWHRAGEAIGWTAGLTEQAPSGLDDAQLAVLLEHVLWPMVVGAVPNVALVWLGFYLPLRGLVAAYQITRRRRRERAGIQPSGVSQTAGGPHSTESRAS